jgi:hypothetical protein
VLARPNQIGPSLTIAFDKAPGRTYAEIAAVLRTATALAEMDAEHSMRKENEMRSTTAPPSKFA